MHELWKGPEEKKPLWIQEWEAATAPCDDDGPLEAFIKTSLRGDTVQLHAEVEAS